MLLPEGIARAAARWLQLLPKLSVESARTVLRSNASYIDISSTQYEAALEWLLEVGLWPQAMESEDEPAAHSRERIFAAALAHGSPAWLSDADVLVQQADEIPRDAAGLAQALGLSPESAHALIRQVHGKIDLELRSKVGLAGELALIHELERRWPASTDHVSLRSDGFGYDIALTDETTTWHLEVKSTTRRGRLKIHVSRHEFETGLHDTNWRLVLVGLGGDLATALAVCSVDFARLRVLAPADQHPNGRWGSMTLDLSPDRIDPGLGFIRSRASNDDWLLTSGLATPAPFAWVPASTTAQRAAAT